MISALFFDAAGTLIETAEPVSTSYARILGEHGHAVTAERVETGFPKAFSEAGEPDFRSMPNGELAERSWWRGIVETCVDSPITDEAFDALFRYFARPEAWKLLPDVLSTLETARSWGLRLAVVSNFDSRLHGVLKGLGLHDTFECIVTSADARVRKPAAGIFAHAMDKMQLAPEAIYHVGDSERYDLGGATAAGIRAFLLEPPERGLSQFLEKVGNELRK